MYSYNYIRSLVKMHDDRIKRTKKFVPLVMSDVTIERQIMRHPSEISDIEVQMYILRDVYEGQNPNYVETDLDGNYYSYYRYDIDQAHVKHEHSQIKLKPEAFYKRSVAYTNQIEQIGSADLSVSPKTVSVRDRALKLYRLYKAKSLQLQNDELAYKNICISLSRTTIEAIALCPKTADTKKNRLLILKLNQQRATINDQYQLKNSINDSPLH